MLGQGCTGNCGRTEKGKGILSIPRNTAAKEKPFLGLGAGEVVEGQGTRVWGGVGTE